MIKDYIKENSNLLLILAVVFGIGALSRATDIPNLTAIPAIALLFGYAKTRRVVAYSVITVIMLATDLYYGFHYSMIAVYLSYYMIYETGRISSPEGGSESTLRAGGKAIGLSVLAAALFFFVTNTAVWMEAFIPGNSAALYSGDLSGLMASWTAGLAFARQFGFPMLTGTLLFTVPGAVVYTLTERKKVARPTL
ncbi:MAG: hypothetical protein Kapaf2KO_18130 [Candidatus Kapaibacteriales bacterium]